LFLAHYHLPLLRCHVASNFSSSGSSFLFPWPASHGYAVAICSNFLLGLCRHLQVACYLCNQWSSTNVIANCYLIISIFCPAAAISLLLLLPPSIYYIKSFSFVSCSAISIQVHIYFSGSSMPCVSTKFMIVSQPISLFCFMVSWVPSI